MPAGRPAWPRHSPDWPEAEAFQLAAVFAEQGGANLCAVDPTAHTGAAGVARVERERSGRIFGGTCPDYPDLHPVGLLAQRSPPIHRR